MANTLQHLFMATGPIMSVGTWFFGVFGFLALFSGNIDYIVGYTGLSVICYLWTRGVNSWTQRNRPDMWEKFQDLKRKGNRKDK